MSDRAGEIPWERWVITIGLLWLGFCAVLEWKMSAVSGSMLPQQIRQPDTHSNFQDYLRSGEHSRVLHMQRKAYANCMVALMAGEDVHCGKRPED